MPSITTIHESLPYIDPPPSPPSLAAATALITSESHLTPPDPNHALLPPPYTPRFLTPLLAPLLSSPTPPAPLATLDLTRYEAPDTTTFPADSTSLARAYTSHAYVASRRAHLALLDAYGKNAWLVGNWYLEGELKAVERELAAARREIDLLTVARQAAQEGAGPEMKGLEENWRRGVARVLETEAAAEGLRREVLEGARRAAAKEAEGQEGR